MLTDLNMNMKSDFQLLPSLPSLCGRYHLPIPKAELINTCSVFFSGKFLAVFVNETG